MPRNPKDDIPWTEAEDAYLIAHRASESLGQIGKALGRTRCAVGGRASRLGLSNLSREEVSRRNAHGGCARQSNASPLRKPSQPVLPPSVCAPVALDDPATRAASAILDNARNAEARRAGFRGSRT